MSSEEWTLYDGTNAPPEDSEIYIRLKDGREFYHYQGKNLDWEQHDEDNLLWGSDIYAFRVPIYDQ